MNSSQLSLGDVLLRIFAAI